MKHGGTFLSDAPVIFLEARGALAFPQSISRVYARNGLENKVKRDAEVIKVIQSNGGVSSVDSKLFGVSANWSKLQNRLTQFRDLEPGWDGYKAAPPSELTLVTAGFFLDYLQRLNYPPVQLTPLVIGGIGFTFRGASRKVYVEFSNKGNVHALFSDGSSNPVVEKITPNEIAYRLLIGKTKAYLDE